MQVDPERNSELAKAMQSVQAAIPKAEADPNRPGFHFRAPANWMNDPNGPICYNGWYHVFYQFNPYGDKWGHMHWGHARSRDLVDWEHLPIALWPSLSKGEEHIYSGSCYPAPGPLGPKTPTAFYTSIGHPQPEQWSASPEDPDLIHWHKSLSNPVLTSDLAEWRDPFVFAAHGSTWMVTGGGKNGRGIVALYRAYDDTLQRWKPSGMLFEYPDSNVANIECPNFTQVGNRWLLLVSVHGQVEYFLGDLNSDMKLQWTTRGVLNSGSYASQVVHDPRGLPIHLAWVPTEDHSRWNGYLTLPSNLSLSPEGQLQRQPIPALTHLREQSFKLKDVKLNQPMDLTPKIAGEMLEIVADVDLPNDSQLEIDVRQQRDKVHAEKRLYSGKNGRLDLHLFVDRGVLDEYLDQGRECRTVQFRTSPQDTGLTIAPIGTGVHIRSVEVYKLRAAKFDLSRFR